MIATSLNLPDFKVSFLRFVGLIDARSWRTRAVQIRQVISGNVYAEEYLTEDNELCLALNELTDIWDRFGLFPLTLKRKHHLFFAMAFIAQTVSLIDAVSEKEGRQLANRITGAIKNNPEDIRALQLELATATHFLLSGYNVSFPDATGSERFDLLVKGAGELDVEVECKFITRDKGKKVHRKDLHEFHQMVVPHVDAHLGTSSSNVIVEIVVADRFPTSLGDKRRLSEKVRDSLINGSTESSDDIAEVSIRNHPLDEISVSKFDKEKNRDLVDKLTGTTNQNILISENKHGRKTILVVRSNQNDTVLDSIYETLSEASKKQLTGKRPALLVARLHSIGIDGLVRVASQQDEQTSMPNTLQFIATKLLKQKHHEHLVSVCFMSESEIGPRDAGKTPSHGAIYHFKNETSPLWGRGYNFNFSPIT